MDLLKEILSEQVLDCSLDPSTEEMSLFLFLGVNGVGKTTTIAKIANLFKAEKPGSGIVLSAGDTFRAAAIDQLKLHGERLGLRVVHQSHGSDPGAVILILLKVLNPKAIKLFLLILPEECITKQTL